MLNSWRTSVRIRAPAAMATAICLAFPFYDGFAQQIAPTDEHSHHDHMAPAAPTTAEQKGPGQLKLLPRTEPANKKATAKKTDRDHSEHAVPAPAAKKADHAGHTDSPPTAVKPATSGESHVGHGGMKGFLGPYGMSREGSGTSWLPDTTPEEGIHGKYGDWNTMFHALINGVYDHQGGARGGNKSFVSGMVMGMAQRPLGEGTLGLRAMLSPEPFMGPNGYPLLLASGETADGHSPLIDRQHPHDLFMELATTFSHPLSANSSVFVYAGLPGEPALGPPAFMHRTSGVDIPEAPITHHWLDSTHIAFGVVTAGVVLDNWKFDASTFRGREPNQYRYDIEAPKLDSYSARVTFNPIRELSMQVSWGHLNSPEQLMPNVNEDRFTASASYTQPLGGGDIWSTTVAWGRKMLKPGDALNGFLLESTYSFAKRYTVFVRAERVQENELGEGIVGLEGRIFTVNELTLGGIYDIPLHDKVKFGVGALVSKSVVPGDLAATYGGNPTSYMLFARLKVM